MRYAWVLWVMVILASIGLADAGYLTFEHLRHGEVSCSFFGGCESVTGSEYGQIGPVPTSVLGIIYYGGMLLVLIMARVRRSERLFRLMAWATFVGLLVSMGLVYIQIAVLRSICIFCMASALTSTLLFVFGIAILFLQRRRIDERIQRET